MPDAESRPFIIKFIEKNFFLVMVIGIAIFLYIGMRDCKHLTQEVIKSYNIKTCTTIENVNLNGKLNGKKEVQKFFACVYEEFKKNPDVLMKAIYPQSFQSKQKQDQVNNKSL